MSVHTFSCLDGHTCGNPVRLVTGGAPLLRGATMSERRQDFLARYDWIRQALMFEPRGHDVMSGSMLYPPTREDCDVAILFIEVSGCLPMCGHGTIGTVTMAVENGLLAPATPGIVNLDVPAGRVVARYEQKGRFVESVRITNVASYLAATSTPSSSHRRTTPASRRCRRARCCGYRRPCAGCSTRRSRRSIRRIRRSRA
jgi:4-hydroxyproline epimerase